MMQRASELDITHRMQLLVANFARTFLCRLCLAFCWLVGGSSPLWANESISSVETRLEESRNPLKLAVQWQGESFFADKMPTRGRPQRLFMSLQLEGAGSARVGAFEADGAARGYLGVPSVAEYSSFEIMEASVGAALVRTRETKLGLYLGRRRQDWSIIDRAWSLGVTEPSFRWDPLRPSRNGLTGIFVELKSRGFEFVAFGSGIAIPESGPSSAIRNGIFTSSHPFYLPPPENAPLIGVDTPIRYTIEMPSIEKLILKPSVGGMMGYEHNGFFAHAAYQYKPLTKPLLSMRSQGIYNLSTEQIEPVLRPQIVQSHVVSADVGYRSETISPWVSALWDSPEAPIFEPGYTTQRFPAGGWLGFGSDFSVFKGKAKLSYLQSFLGVASDVGPLSTGGYDGFFESRYMFRQAVSAQFSYPLFQNAFSSVSWMGRVVRDFAVGGTLLTSEIEWRPINRLSLTLGADLISAQVSSASNGGADFLHDMQNFDRVRGALRFEL